MKKKKVFPIFFFSIASHPLDLKRKIYFVNKKKLWGVSETSIKIDEKKTIAWKK